MRRLAGLGVILLIAAGLVATSARADDLQTCRTGHGDESIVACTRVIASGNFKGNELADLYLDRGVERKTKGDFDGAIADYNQAIRLAPNSAMAYNNRGNARKSKNDLDGAIADFNQAIQLDPKYTLAYDNRGDARKAKGDIDGAMADYDLVVRLDPSYAAAYVDRGLIYEQRKDFARARAEFNAALAASQNGDIGKWAYDMARSHLAKLPTAPAEQVTEIAKLPPADLGRRVALVIGNSGYKAVAALPNPSRDAAAVAAALRSAGFQTVTLETDLPFDRFNNALRLFARLAGTADWAVIYYAGHGMEMNGINYLVPVDAKLETDRDVTFEAVPLDQVMNAVEGARKLRVVILDACRDNPFASQMKRTTASRSIGRGLAKVEPDGGTLVAYAAKGGEVALDGEGQNSPFVTALLKYLPMPNVEIGKFFRLVRDDVLNSTGHKQEPFVYGSLPSDDFFFAVK